MNKIIVLSVATVAILTFSGCDKADKAVEATKQATTEVASKTTDVAKEAANKAVEATKEAASNVAEKAKETADKAVEATKEAASNVADKAKETATKAVEATKEAASNVAEKAKETAAAATGGDDKGAALFTKCKSCHGADGKTKALGKSEVIAGQSAEDLAKKLTEYKAGTRNVAGMGTLMKGQVAPMSDEEIKALATYISNLK